MIEIVKIAYEHPGTTAMFLILIALCMPRLEFHSDKKPGNKDEKDKEDKC